MAALCAACAGLPARRDRREGPHSRLQAAGEKRSYGHMFGGGTDRDYVCLDCGTTLTHSTDKADFGWF